MQCFSVTNAAARHGPGRIMALLAVFYENDDKATPSHTLVSGHRLSDKSMRAGGRSGLQDYAGVFRAIERFQHVINNRKTPFRCTGSSCVI